MWQRFVRHVFLQQLGQILKNLCLNKTKSNAIQNTQQLYMFNFLVLLTEKDKLLKCIHEVNLIYNMHK